MAGLFHEDPQVADEAKVAAKEAGSHAAGAVGAANREFPWVYHITWSLVNVKQVNSRYNSFRLQEFRSFFKKAWWSGTRPAPKRRWKKSWRICCRCSSIWQRGTSNCLRRKWLTRPGKTWGKTFENTRACDLFTEPGRGVGTRMFIPEKKTTCYWLGLTHPNLALSGWSFLFSIPQNEMMGWNGRSVSFLGDGSRTLLVLGMQEGGSMILSFTCGWPVGCLILVLDAREVSIPSSNRPTRRWLKAPSV